MVWAPSSRFNGYWPIPSSWEEEEEEEVVESRKVQRIPYGGATRRIIQMGNI
jgi:hypothetical protein